MFDAIDLHKKIANKVPKGKTFFQLCKKTFITDLTSCILAEPSTYSLLFQHHFQNQAL